MSASVKFLEALFSIVDDGYVAVSGCRKNGDGYIADADGNRRWFENLSVVPVGDVADLVTDEGERWFTTQPRIEPRRGGESNTSAVVCVIADFDFVESSSGKDPDRSFTSVSDVQEFCANHVPLPPSALVESGHGVHGYWFLSEPLEPGGGKELLTRFDTFIRGAAADAGYTMDVMKDLARVLRVPGSVNEKYPDAPVPVRVAEFDPIRRYSTDDFVFCPDAGFTSVNPDTSHIGSSEVDEWRSRLPEGDEGFGLIAEWARILKGATPGHPEKGRHPTAMSLMGKATIAAEGGRVDFSTAVGVLERVFSEIKPGGAAEFRSIQDQAIRYRIAQSTAEPDGDASTPPKPPEDRALRSDEVDNSTRLIQLHGDHLRYVLKWKKWIAWGEHAWTLDGGDVRAREMAKDVSSALYHQAGEENNPDTARKISAWASRSASRSGIEGMVHLARGIDGVPIRHDELDTDPWLFGVHNGVVDLNTGEYRSGDPADLMYRQAGTGYDPDAGCPLWEQCMIDWFPDEETRRYVQRLAGSALVGKQKDHLFIIHYGGGGNGKGTFMRAVAHVMGDYFITPDKSLIVTERHEKHDTERAALFRIRLAVAAETDKRQKLNEAQIKNLTGGDPIHARRLYEDPWEFLPSHSMWLQTNYLPEIQGRDGGIWRRIRVVPWVVTFNGDRQDTDLDDRLESEAAGILNWLIEGCLDWQRNGLNEPAAVIAATAEYRAAEDVFQRFAEATGLTFQKDLEVTAKHLGDSITEWGQDEGLTRMPSVGERADWLKGHGASSRRMTRASKKVTVWCGVGFDTIDDDPHDPTGGQERPEGLDTPDTPIQETIHEAALRESPRTGVSRVSTSIRNDDPGSAPADHPSAPTCPNCRVVPKAIYPSGLCRDCDTNEVAP